MTWTRPANPGIARTLLLGLLAGLLSTTSACTARRPVGHVGQPPVAQAEHEQATAAEAADPSENVDSADTAQTDATDAPASDSEASTSTPEPVSAQRAAPGGLRRRAEAGVEGLIIGTVVGGQIGSTYGAAVGAALFGIYGLITGDVPFESGKGNKRTSGRRAPGEDADVAMEREIEKELARQETLESEIEDELRRQEELLAAITKQEEVNTIRDEIEECSTQEKTGDTLSAPRPPCERKIPDSIFDKAVRKDGRKERLVKTLDADRDGRPEIEIVIDAENGRMLSRSEDTDYDGLLDAQSGYDENGKIKSLQEDTNGDGLPDRFVSYADANGSRVEVDRNFDGKRDGFYVYEHGTLSYEEHDTNNDGKIDRRVEYQGKRRLLEREDGDYDGRMDSTTHFDAKGVPVRNERDTNRDGKTDVWEYYEGKDPAKILLARKEEDVNHDGDVDVTSHYKRGKLYRKDVTDPDLAR